MTAVPTLAIRQGSVHRWVSTWLPRWDAMSHFRI
jgi:hypothetical protein